MFAHPLLPGIAELQISHSEKFDISLAQKGLAWMSQLTLYNAPRSYGRSIYGRPDRGCGRSPSRSVIAGRSALAWLSACSRSALLRLVLRTQPRSGPVRFGTASASKFLTVRSLISRSPRRG